MKLIQLTDLHIVPNGEHLWGLDPSERLRAAVDDINSNHGDAEHCIVTGDLANKGQIGAYEELQQALAPLNLPVHLLLGNHDDRDEFCHIFPEAHRDDHGFVQGMVETGSGVLLFLDTHEPGVAWGSYCEKRLAWLQNQLEQQRDLPIYLFMHHPPFEIGIPSLDVMTMRDGAAFGELLSGHPNVRHLFFGHVHRPVAGSWRGIPVSSFRGTNHQVPLDFKTINHVPKNHDAPAYAIILIEANQTIVHFHDFLNETAIVG